MKVRNWQQAGMTTFPASYDFEAEGKKILEGEITQHKTVRIGDSDRRIVTIQADKEEYTIWISAGLTALDNLPDGVYVHIEFVGYEKGKKGMYKKYIVLFDPETIKEPF